MDILDDNHEIDAGDVAAVLARLGISILLISEKKNVQCYSTECQKCIKFAFNSPVVFVMPTFTFRAGSRSSAGYDINATEFA